MFIPDHYPWTVPLVAADASFLLFHRQFPTAHSCGLGGSAPTSPPGYRFQRRTLIAAQETLLDLKREGGSIIQGRPIY